MIIYSNFIVRQEPLLKLVLNFEFENKNLDEIPGKFTFDLYVKKEITRIDENIGIFIGKKKMIAKLENLAKTNFMKEICLFISEKKREKIAKKYCPSYDIKIPMPTINLNDYIKS